MLSIVAIGNLVVSEALLTSIRLIKIKRRKEQRKTNYRMQQGVKI